MMRRGEERGVGQLVEGPPWSESRERELGQLGHAQHLPFISPGWAHSCLCDSVQC